MYYTGH